MNPTTTAEPASVAEPATTAEPVTDEPATAEPATAVFDPLAAGYDTTFTDTRLGTIVRAATWRRLDACFAAGERVLELNCGTGADAVHLAQRGVRVVATDVSPAMVAATTARVAASGLGALVTTSVVDAGALGGTLPLGHDATDRFDGAVSNFGGLNCVADLPALFTALGARVRPGGTAVLGIMGPVVPWEWAWQLSRGKPAAAVRRLRPGGARWRGTVIRYPTPRAVERAAAPWFRRERLTAIGALLPPTDAQPWADRHPRLLHALDRAERRVETVPGVAWLADHYLLELRRV